ALAGGTHMAMRPVSLDEFSDVGEEFYPEFKDPNAATGLRVAAYNKEAARVDVFNVEFKDGLWRIPSHHNYPADGEERLAKTATSIIGIKRDAVASTSAADFKRLGVLDPLDETVTGTEGRGDRITLLQGDSVLADYIIGTKIEGPDNVYNVRKPDENRTYRAALDIDISTKFGDWIEPDLLSVTRGDLREIDIDGYSVDETRGVIVPGDVSRLTRSSSTAAWELEGLAATEKVKTSEVNSVINALEDLKIVGVRPKPPGLSADLKGDEAAKLDTRAMIDLQSKGYFVDALGALVSNEGEVRVGTSEGVLYILRFGEVFTGTDVEIEVGKAKADATDPEGSESVSDTVAKGDAETTGDDDDPTAKDPSQKHNRYLFITAQFHDDLISAPGEKPVEPEQPAAKLESEPDADAAAKPPEEPGGADAADTPDEPADAETNEGDDAAEESPEEKAYQQALADYKTQLEKWESDQQAYEEKLTKGRERVKELNTRFADWYYVISAETFDKIRIERTNLVEAKEPEDDKAAPNATDLGGPQIAPPVPRDEPADGDEPQSDASQPPAIDESTLPAEDPKFAPPPADAPPSDALPDKPVE
ncbi:MAG: DUF4340 domain-containing protein, partial [Planctomycetaceae bacterium]